MEIYVETSVVKKEHAKIIADRLFNLKSKVPKDIESDLKENKKNVYALASLLHLACGGGKYKLEIDKMMSINNELFSIKESALHRLCQRSPTRQR